MVFQTDMCSLWVLLFSLGIGCLASCPPRQKCIYKCCPFNMTMSRSGNCVPSDVDIIEYNVDEYITEEYNDTIKYVYYMLNCSMYKIDPTTDAYRVHHNGSLTLYYKEFPPATTEYCQDIWEGNISIFACITEQDMVKAQEEEDLGSVLIFYAVGLFISAPLLLATAVIYASIRVLRNLHGYCLIFHNLTLFVLYMLLGLVQVKVIYQKILCQVVGKLSFHLSIIYSFVYYICSLSHRKSV